MLSQFAVGKVSSGAVPQHRRGPRPSRMQLGFIDEHVPAGDLHMVCAPVCR